jgi:hypothetical protein
MYKGKNLSVIGAEREKGKAGWFPSGKPAERENVV